ncbi:hypothetical protein PA598K_07160 [Paenibacillus sp. 598K]|uniref:hypothetical protein n=1 Tax=Paenibacillus sp. 598K TaxID=1117987 RepID=UPI000FF9DC46|nr:hypothetical protein [Paenibacillus sp. 598K]GBF78506.1 hypothetical protein PA598K_07160 [Paenibacillus sp. 598K]
MRSAKDNNFPYSSSTVCYFEVDKNGKVSQIYHKNKSDRPKLLEVYQRVNNNATTLYAVWPGKWSSDLFIIDDLDAFAKGFNLI